MMFPGAYLLPSTDLQLGGRDQEDEEQGLDQLQEPVPVPV